MPIKTLFSGASSSALTRATGDRNYYVNLPQGSTIGAHRTSTGDIVWITKRDGNEPVGRDITITSKTGVIKYKWETNIPYIQTTALTSSNILYGFVDGAGSSDHLGFVKINPYTGAVLDNKYSNNGNNFREIADITCVYDSDGYIWIGGTCVNLAGNQKPFIAKFNTADDTFSFIQILDYAGASIPSTGDTSFVRYHSALEVDENYVYQTFRYDSSPNSLESTGIARWNKSDFTRDWARQYYHGGQMKFNAGGVIVPNYANNTIFLSFIDTQSGVGNRAGFCTVYSGNGTFVSNTFTAYSNSSTNYEIRKGSTNLGRDPITTSSSIPYVFQNNRVSYKNTTIYTANTNGGLWLDPSDSWHNITDSARAAAPVFPGDNFNNVYYYTASDGDTRNIGVHIRKNFNITNGVILPSVGGRQLTKDETGVEGVSTDTISDFVNIGSSNISVSNTLITASLSTISSSYYCNVNANTLSVNFFEPSNLFEVELLMVAGGGSGGSDNGGGGGAGGLLNITTALEKGTNYVVSVGAGAGGSGAYGQGQTGTDSTFAGFTSFGGGGGGGTANRSGASGGSGGGSSQGQPAGSGVTGQGFPGSVGGGASGGGGGGAGEAGGTDGTGYGGDGLEFSAWATATNTGDGGYYAGGGTDNTGGDGRLGGQGGGGTYSGTKGGATNTGGGSAGDDGGVSSQAGGSGIIIIRYSGARAADGGSNVITTGGYTYHTFTSTGTFTANI